MIQDLYTRLYVRAKESGDDDLLVFLEATSRRWKSDKELIERLQAELDGANKYIDEIENA